jgi:MurNAc alpha-1-phosphate uridylyltransferase
MPDSDMPKLAILAGGLATRMRPATLRTAKSMLPVAGEPFLGHQIRMLAVQGIREIVICCGHLEEQLREYAGDGCRWGCDLLYSADGPTPLGTGGALRKALPLLGSQFMVMYGDSYLPTDFAPVWKAFLRSKLEGLMTVYPNADRWNTSNVQFEGNRIRDYNKQVKTRAMRHIDYGLSCFRADAFHEWPAGARFDLADITAALLKKSQLAGFQVNERFFEIGSPAGHAETNALLQQHLTELWKHA